MFNPLWSHVKTKCKNILKQPHKKNVRSQLSGLPQMHEKWPYICLAPPLCTLAKGEGIEQQPQPLWHHRCVKLYKFSDTWFMKTQAVPSSFPGCHKTRVCWSAPSNHSAWFLDLWTLKFVPRVSVRNLSVIQSSCHCPPQVHPTDALAAALPLGQSPPVRFAPRRRHQHHQARRGWDLNLGASIKSRIVARNCNLNPL